MRSHLNLTGMMRDTVASSVLNNLDGTDDQLSIQLDSSQKFPVGKSLQSLPIRKARKDGATSVPAVTEQLSTINHVGSSKGLSQRKRSYKKIEKVQ